MGSSDAGREGKVGASDGIAVGKAGTFDVKWH